MKLIYLIYIVGVIAAIMGSMSAQAQSMTIPTELLQLANQSLDVACKYNEKEVAKFDATMSELGTKVDMQTFESLRPQDGQSMQAKIIILAYYRAQHEEIYDKIMDVFYNVTEHSAGLRNVAGPQSPNVAKEYATNEYRPIWEYYLLSGRVSGIIQYNGRLRGLNFSSWRPIEALGLIGDVKSLNVLDFVYERFLSQASDTFNFSTSGLILQSILKIGTASNDPRNAFKVFFHCYTLTEGSDAKMAKAKFYSKNADDFFLMQFGGMPKDVLKKWQAAARAYPQTNLSPREVKFIQTILDRT